tara:strand:- start:19983 stop:20498 length:516 start_codon:yes stop_codon:yes gene_type:complete
VKDIIFIAGAPGTGKTTISNLLKTKLNNPPLIDFGWIRQFHLNKKWTNANKKEEQMSFENLTYILKNYVKYKYKHIIVNDLEDFRIKQLPKIFSKYKFIIISLVVKDDEELKNRILSERDSGFKDVKASLLWNKRLIKRRCIKNEMKIDNTHKDPRKMIGTILEIIKREKV